MPFVRSVMFGLVTRLSLTQKRLILVAMDMGLAPIALLAAVLMAEAGPSLGDIARQLVLFGPALSVMAAGFSVMLRLPMIKLSTSDMDAVMRSALQAVLVSLGLVALAIMGSVALPRAVIMLFGLTLFLLCTGGRIVLLTVQKWVLRQGKPRVRVLIYGAGDTGMQLARALMTHDSILPVGFVDDNPALHNFTAFGLRIHPALGIRQVAQRLGADRILLAMPSMGSPKLAQLGRQLGADGLRAIAMPSFVQLMAEGRLAEAIRTAAPGQFLGRESLDTDLPQGAEAYVGRSVMVTGGGGSVGSELCRQLLLHRPRRIVVLEANEFAAYTLNRELEELCPQTATQIVTVLGSVTNARLVRQTIVQHEVDTVFHAAAYKHVPMVEANPIVGIENNVIGTRVLAEAAVVTRVRNFVLISTDKAVRPTNVMGASKRMAELVVQDMAKRPGDTAFSIVRFGNVVGSSGSVIPLFQDQIARGGPVTVTHAEVTRYFMTLSEAARLVLLAGSFQTQRGGAEVYVLDMGKPVRIFDLAEQMIVAAGYRVRSPMALDGDIEIAVTGLRPGEKLHEELLIGEGLCTTPHPKILRAREEGLAQAQMQMALRQLRIAVAEGDGEAARSLLSVYVEGYGAVPLPKDWNDTAA